eukprot:5934385-Amphidinium_carterae.1
MVIIDACGRSSMNNGDATRKAWTMTGHPYLALGPHSKIEMGSCCDISIQGAKHSMEWKQHSRFHVT